MRKVSFVIVFVLMAGLISKARGEDVEQVDLLTGISEPLTLDQCIKIALQRSPGIRTAGLDLETASLDVADARAGYLPEIDASGQYRFSDTIDFGWERQNYDAQIAASYTIWDHGRREAGLAQAKADERAVQSDYDRTEQDLIFDITEAYYDLSQAEKLIEVNEKLLEISSGNVAKVTAFLEAESAIPADLSAARVQQANDELALINAQSSLEVARASLASLMGLDPGTPIEITDSGEVPALPGMWEVSLEDAIATAIQKRPELDRMRAGLTSQEWSLKLARLDRWPMITAECNYGVLLDDYLRDRDNFKEYRNWSAVARISFPIFDSALSRRREQSAEIAIQQMKEQIYERERAITLEVQQAYLNLERARKSLEIAREQVKDATESLNVTQGMFEENMVIFLELLSAQARYAQSLTNQVKAFYDYKIAERSLQKAIGTLQVGA